MPGSSKITTGDIFLVKFHPGYGSEFEKYRPAVIASGVTTAIDSRFVLIVPLTTNTQIVKPNYELLVSDNPALEKDSLLLCWYLWTIDKSRLIRKLGCLEQMDKEKMLRTIRSLF